MNTKIEISHRTILFTLALITGIWFLSQISDILILLLISFIFMTALRPVVEIMERIKIPRAIAIIFIYIVIIGIFGFSFAGIIPSLLGQLTRFIQDFPSFVERVLPRWNIELSTFSQNFAPISRNFVKVTVGVFSNIISTLAVLVITFYFLLERRNIRSLLNTVIGEKAASRFISVMKQIEDRIGAWVRGQIFLMIFIGLLVYIVLAWLRIEFVLPLAIIAGLLEIVPIIGPVISAVPAVLIGLTVSPYLAAIVALAYFLIQQVENNIIVPLVMKKSVGLPPVVTLLALMVGARFAGVSGAVLAVPVVVIIQVVAKEFFKPQ